MTKNKKKYRVTHIVNMMGDEYIYPIDTLKDAKTLIYAIANIELEYCGDTINLNFFDIEEYEEDATSIFGKGAEELDDNGGAWLTWYDEEGFDYKHTTQTKF